MPGDLAKMAEPRLQVTKFTSFSCYDVVEMCFLCLLAGKVARGHHERPTWESCPCAATVSSIFKESPAVPTGLILFLWISVLQIPSGLYANGSPNQVLPSSSKANQLCSPTIWGCKWVPTLEKLLLHCSWLCHLVAIHPLSLENCYRAHHCLSLASLESILLPFEL